MKARAVDVKVNVPLFKTGRKCFQQAYFRIKETKSALPLPHYKKMWARPNGCAPLPCFFRTVCTFLRLCGNARAHGGDCVFFQTGHLRLRDTHFVGNFCLRFAFKIAQL